MRVNLMQLRLSCRIGLQCMQQLLRMPAYKSGAHCASLILCSALRSCNICLETGNERCKGLYYSLASPTVVPFPTVLSLTCCETRNERSDGGVLSNTDSSAEAHLMSNPPCLTRTAALGDVLHPTIFLMFDGR